MNKETWSRRSALALLSLPTIMPADLWAQPAEQSRYRDAFRFAFPAYEFIRTGWLSAGPNAARGHRFNQFAGRPQLLDHTARQVTTPNADTLYASARLILDRGPVAITIPPVADHYFSLAIIDAFTDNIRIIHGHRDRRLRVTIAGLAHRPDPARGDDWLRANGVDLWALARIGPYGTSGMAGAQAIQTGLRIDAPPVEPFPVIPGAGFEPARFVAVVNAALARLDLRSPHLRRARAFNACGLGPRIEPGGATLTPEQDRNWRAAGQMVMAELGAGWPPSRRESSGWEWPPAGVGDFGENEQLRAAVALSGLAALPASEATYAMVRTDTAGASLDGANRYCLRVPAHVPVDAFWSLTTYRREPDGRLFFAENPARRYTINSREPGLLREADGSVSVTLAPPEAGTAPGTSRNWLPSAPGPMVAVFRAYRPQRTLLAGRWKLPGLVRC